MDSSKILEGNEECSSNESGWTMYIASPIDKYNLDDEDDHSGSIDKQEDGLPAKDDGDTDSNDSMASDASSGPSHREHLRNHVRGRHCPGVFGHAGDKDNRKRLGKKHHQQEEKQPCDEQIKAAKDKPGHKGNSAGRLKKK
ncbi:uncharacterized protein LOC111398943 [Olea europaea var. sylvestris]|uniref:uncharacterized protein LOC111398943 n=1 Tax=Olea europaea var. sylvestris TaxID=158386 RepID=UPI000C1D7E3C|nr:uncharacterized protein LOC111398943 [Olea europaea var. sylvestris]